VPVLLDLGRRFGVHDIPGAGKVLLRHAVDDLDTRTPAYRKGSCVVGHSADVDRQSEQTPPWP